MALLAWEACSTESSISCIQLSITLLANEELDCRLLIIDSISDVDCVVRCARTRTSSATTAKPRPCSPARAASIAALSAKRLVCSAILRMTSKIEPIWLLILRKSPTASTDSIKRVSS
ncbi:Uncharacterised protein [Vibrio cholerae]|nr:Uncharacterised protein [Vibrio cholerae]